MARKKPKGPPHDTRGAAAKLKPFGKVVQCSEYHWQVRGEVFVDWWPASGKWMHHDTQEVRIGGFGKMVACLREWGAVKALDVKPTDAYEIPEEWNTPAKPSGPVLDAADVLTRF
jgi:hypothetical protein